MNKRYYEHTLPIIRGSLSNTYVELVKLSRRIVELSREMEAKWSQKSV